MSNYKTANGLPPSKDNPCLNIKNGVCIIACHGCCWPYKMTPEAKPVSKATPRPWHVKELDDIFIEPKVMMYANYWVPYETRKANAELIVRAVNRDHLFDRMIDELQDYLEALENLTQTKNDAKRIRKLLTEAKELSK